MTYRNVVMWKRDKRNKNKERSEASGIKQKGTECKRDRQ